MAAVTNSDGSENVEDFLRRIKDLGNSREDEDAKLDQDILEGRKQREARRTERARSISPEKQSPLTTPRSSKSPNSASMKGGATSPTLSSTMRMMSLDDSLKASQSPKQDVNLETTRFPSRPEVQSQSSSSSTPVHIGRTSSPSSRASPTISQSWAKQQSTSRNSNFDPSSPGGKEERSSPNASQVIPSIEQDIPTSRTQIAHSLASKDPAWFRQTADRGVGSAAYRKNNDGEDTSHTSTAGKRHLHGLAKDTSISSQDLNSPASSIRSQSPSMSNSMAGDVRSTSSTTSASIRGRQEEKGVMPTHTSQIFKAPDESTPRVGMVSSSSERLERPVSPTKGIGGFVQSAMLRRSDSISKRWTVQNAGGLNRPQNVSPTRGENVGYQDTFKGHNAKLGALPPSTSRENSLEPSARPDSSHSGSTIKQEKDTPSLTIDLEQSSRSLPKAEESSRTEHKSKSSTSMSPSKRWSPTKASWLESALTKPDSPKPKPPAPSQPQWMTDLNKTRQSRTSKDLGQNQTLHFESSTGSLSKEEISSPKKSSISPPSTKPKPSNFPTKPTNHPETQELQSKGYRPSEDVLEDQHSGSSNDLKLSKSPSGTLKSKPETPPKKNIVIPSKSTTRPTENKPEEGPEFLKAFGTLKRTKTQNYVAPDILKDNILRGKADLTVTGGPKKTKRRDSFKESLISQRETMKAKASETPTDIKSDAKSKPSPPVPEALAKKKALGKTNNTGNIIKDETPKTFQNQEQGETSRSNDKEPASAALSNDATDSIEMPASTTNSNSDNKFANRFNPALANVIARGRPAPKSNSASPITSPQIQPSRSNSEHVTEESSTGLQHMTKARARGPKRRPPKVNATSVTDTTHKPSARLPTSPNPSYSTASPSNIVSKAQESANSWSNGVMEKPRSPVPPQKPNKPDNSTLDSLRANEDANQSSRPSMSVKNATALWGQNKDQKMNSEGSRAPIKLPTREDEQTAMQNAGLVRDKEIQKDHGSPGLVEQSSPKPTTSKFSQSSTQNNTFVASKSRALTDHGSPKPKPPVKPSNETKRVASASLRNINSLQIQESNPKRALQEFFDEPPRADGKLDIDTQGILSANKEGPSKIKTLRKTINEISEDGKISPLSSNQEHVLYDDAMYLCTHVFGDTKGARITEVYLWTGKSVSQTSSKDAEPFAKKAAKDVGGNLIVLKQGGEPTEFFQALGGIVITRTRKHDESSELFALCGRRHLGHIAFDQVPFSLTSLCSGFPFLLNHPSQQTLYLWKGIGCDAEELGCARLIGMDLMPSSSVEEIDEGKETQSFMDLFTIGLEDGRKEIAPSADHWKLKPKHDSYRNRLFRVQPSNVPAFTSSVWSMMQRRGSRPNSAHATGKAQVVEITPFSQSDLDSEGIFVLDAFFEIYVLVGPLSSAYASIFASAVLFAQEYGMLAASTEDRPFVPKSTIVLEGAPHDMKACFRGWDDDRVDSSSLIAGKRRTGSPRVVPLTAALDAMKA